MKAVSTWWIREMERKAVRNFMGKMWEPFRSDLMIVITSGEKLNLHFRTVH
jgi:hypothetical protein